ncbi:MAG TPA: efflux RND transporter periplasmic adaptor subunit [Casimicrobiaceae bacterium]|nr:efflux RND transporter periplasmic adaptor subunit [Casimicrobiaceae bacterium]
MNKGALAAIVAVAIAAAAGGGYWLGNRNPLPATAATPAAPATKGGPGAGGQGGAPQATPVETAAVETVRLPQTITAVGSLRSDESVTVRPEVAGRIAAIQFKEGQRVSRGMTLLRLDAAINEAELQQARANHKLARTKYDRAVDLAKSNFISGQARDEAENILRVAEAALAVVEARLAKTEIKAPFAGIIGLRSISVGDYVKEGADLVNLESIDPLKVDLRVPEVYLRRVQSGQPLEITLDAYPNRTFEGRVIAVNPLLDAAGRSVVIRAQVKNQDASLRPGMFARVRLITKDVAEALVVPEQALVPQGNEQFVFKVIDNRAVRAKVELGQRREGKVEIVNGVTAGEMVVTAGQHRLRDGATVSVRNAKSPPAPTDVGKAPAAAVKTGS